jgi:hypothetical protein
MNCIRARVKNHPNNTEQQNNNFFPFHLLSNIFYCLLLTLTQIHYFQTNIQSTPIINMKASIILPTIALLFSSAIATPIPGAAAPAVLFTFSLTNDQSGASATSSVVVNSGPVTLGAIFPWAANLRQTGQLVATSAQNVNPAVKNVACVIKGNGRVIKINDKITFADLDGNAGKAVPTVVENFTIECEQ